MIESDAEGGHPITSKSQLFAPGDINGDGSADLVVSQAGGFRAYAGSDGALLYSVADGTPVARAADENSDGVADLIVWVDRTRGLQVFDAVRGSALRGLASFPDPSALTSLRTLTAIGDLNADGYEDLAARPVFSEGPIAGGRAECSVLSGRSGEPLLSWTTDLTSIGSIGWVGSIGDVNGDGHLDIGVGVTAFGDATGGAPRLELRSGADGSLLGSVNPPPEATARRAEPSRFPGPWQRFASQFVSVAGAGEGGVPLLLVADPSALAPDRRAGRVWVVSFASD